MQTDFWLMMRLAALVEWLPGLEWLDVRSLVGQFGATLSSQVRLNVEAQHLRTAARHFAHWRDVGIPEVHFASEAVIVESFVAGRTVGSYVAGLAADSSAASASAGLDLEISISISRSVPTSCAAAWISVRTLRDGSNHGLHRRSYFLPWYFDRVGSTNHGLHRRQIGKRTPTDPLRLPNSPFPPVATDAVVCRGFGTGTQLGDVLRATLELVRKHGVSIEANYMTLVVNALCLEGLARDLEPSYNVLDAAGPLLAASGALAAPSFAFRAALPFMQFAKRSIDARAYARLTQRAMIGPSRPGS